MPACLLVTFFFRGSASQICGSWQIKIVTTLGNFISYFLKWVPCKWWWIMPLMRKEGDLQPKHEMQIYFKPVLCSWNNSGLRSGGQCFHPANVDTSHASPLHLDPRLLMNQNNRAWRMAFKIASRAKHLKFWLTSHCLYSGLCHLLVGMHFTESTLMDRHIPLIDYTCVAWTRNTWEWTTGWNFRSAGTMGTIRVLHFVMQFQDAFVSAFGSN